MSAAPSRPIMRYYGGKWRLAPWIIGHFPDHRIYVEPFGGAGSVLLRKPRSHSEVWNDLSGEVVNVFRVLRDPASAAELERALRLTPFARAELDLAYRVDDAMTPVERARRTIARAFLGFGGTGGVGQIRTASGLMRRTGFRMNANLSNCVPARDWANFPDQVPLFVERLRGVCIESAPATDVIRRFDGADTLFYLDPPYLPESRTAQGVYEFELSPDDHGALAAQLRGVVGSVVVSGYPATPDGRPTAYAQMFEGWRLVTMDARAIQNIPRTEGLWLNDRAANAFDEARAAAHPRLL